MHKQKLNPAPRVLARGTNTLIPPHSLERDFAGGGVNKVIGLIGCGNMGEAILAQSLKYKKRNFIPHPVPPKGGKKSETTAVKPRSFIISEKDKLKEAFIRRNYHVKAADNIIDLVGKSDILIIAVKPQDIDIALQELHRGIKVWGKRKISVISIAAGITTGHIEGKLHNRVKVIRAMPNIPARIGEGITALTKGRFANSADLKEAEGIFRVLGETVIIKNEGLIDAVTALSGSGPAYFFFIFAAMLAAAGGLGLNKKDANKLIYHTVIGSMGLLKREGFDAKTLISKVASKGGTTEAALKIFGERGLKNILMEAIMAACNRAKEISH
jgi:pyrroline-5-carboxylate reductase